MNDDRRPDPDALLEMLKREEAKQQRGKLKIFLGMSAGVGKTYAMLEAAQQRLVDGVDVVVGYVETHKRAETEALIKGLPVIPRQKLEYRGSILEEMELRFLRKLAIRIFCVILIFQSPTLRVDHAPVLLIRVSSIESTT